MKKTYMISAALLLIVLMAGSVFAAITITDNETGRHVSANTIWAALQAFFGGGVTGAAVGGILPTTASPLGPGDSLMIGASDLWALTGDWGVGDTLTGISEGISLTEVGAPSGAGTLYSLSLKDGGIRSSTQSIEHPISSPSSQTELPQPAGADVPTKSSS